METIYVDTSVFGGCFDVEFKEYSNKLLEEFKKGEKIMMISNLVIKELKTARGEIRRQPLKVPFRHLIHTKNSLKAIKLANKYIAGGALTNSSHADAVHIATATMQGANIVASWNFKHMVNTQRIKLFNTINTNEGYRTIEIMTPREIINPSL